VQGEGGVSEGVVPVVRFAPLRDKRTLLMNWPLPAIRPFYRAPPTRSVVGRYLSQHPARAGSRAGYG
jgi:hypothetical protein